MDLENRSCAEVIDLHNRSCREKFKLAKNTNTPEDVLRELAKDPAWPIREQVAENPSTPDDVLRDLAKDRDMNVRAKVALNINIPLDVLQTLAKDEHEDVRWYVAENPKASSKMLVMVYEYEKSLGEPDEYIIKALYENKNLPYIAKVIIETLFGDML